MMTLTQTLAAFGNPDFKNIAKNEIQAIDSQLLPLQQGLSHSSYVSDNPFNATILNVAETESSLCIKTGIFYSGIIAGCSCADDPTPQDEQTEYCEIQFIIDKQNAETQVSLLAE